VICLARQNQKAKARRIFKRACASANDLGLFAEEYSRQGKEMLGNFPQGLTHLAHIGAALALLNVEHPRDQAAGRAARAH
jgi:GH15 family glucan-1,4-alpha-glucosidase